MSLEDFQKIIIQETKKIKITDNFKFKVFKEEDEDVQSLTQNDISNLHEFLRICQYTGLNIDNFNEQLSIELFLLFCMKHNVLTEKMIKVKDKIFNDRQQEDYDEIEVQLMKLKHEYKFLESMNEYTHILLENKVNDLLLDNYVLNETDALKIKKFHDLLREYSLRNPDINIETLFDNFVDIKHHYVNITIFNQLISNMKEEYKTSILVYQSNLKQIDKTVLLLIIQKKALYIDEIVNLIQIERHEVINILTEFTKAGIIQYTSSDQICLKIK